MQIVALTELLGATVYDPSGAAGRVREVTLAPQEDRSRIAAFIVKTRTGDRTVSYGSVSAINGGIRTSTVVNEWPPTHATDGLFLLERDLLEADLGDLVFGENKSCA